MHEQSDSVPGVTMVKVKVTQLEASVIWPKGPIPFAAPWFGSTQHAGISCCCHPQNAFLNQLMGHVTLLMLIVEYVLDVLRVIKWHAAVDAEAQKAWKCLQLAYHS